MMKKPQVVAISLGGTISCAPSTDGPGLIPAADSTAGFVSADFDLQTVPWSLTDSTEITFDEIHRLAHRARDLENGGADGVVITQGTDTLDDVAWALSLLRPTRRPLVFTGAMRAPSTPGSDAESNLLSAMATSILPGLADCTSGAVVVMNNQIHSARWVHKGHTQDPGAFSSGEVGALGVISEGRPVLLRRDLPHPLPPLCDDAVAAPNVRVALLAATLDQDNALIEAIPDLGYAGLVVEGLGGGHVNGEMAAALGKIAEHIPVIFAARPRAGFVLSRTYGSPGAELDLIDRGCLSAGALSASKARILLTLLLRTGRPRWEIEKLVQKVAMTQIGGTL